MRLKPFKDRRVNPFAAFNNSLTGTVVIILLLLSLLPVLLLGSATYFRSRQLLRNQAALQLEVISQAQIKELELLSANNNKLIDELVSSESFQGRLVTMLESPETNLNPYNILISLWGYQKTSSSHSSDGFDHLSIFSPEGKILLSTNETWTRIDLSQNKTIQPLLKADQSIAVYNPAPLYFNRLVIFTTRRILDDQGNPAAVLVGTTTSPLFRGNMMSAQSFFPSAQALLFTSNGEVLGTHPTAETLSLVAGTGEFSQRLDDIIQSGRLNKTVSYQNATNIPVLGYVRWVPELQMAFVLQVPEQILYDQVAVLSPFNLLLLGIALVISGGVGYMASVRLVTPLLQLTDHARRFSAGDWDQRANINRKDEIGVLANAFNHMIEELTNLYHSMEMKVEARTQQVRLASEIANLATSAINRSEMIRRTVELVVERFQYPYAGIFVLDDSGMYAELEEEHRPEADGPSLVGKRLRVGASSLVGWVAKYNQPRATLRYPEPEFPQPTLLAGSQTEAAVPITLDNRVIAVLDIQSEASQAFDSDTLSALQMLTDQVAFGLQKVRLLESTQINLAETSLLYRTSRQIIQASSAQEVLSLLLEALSTSSYVSGVYTLEKDHISVVAMYDAKNPSSVSNLQGLTLPLKQVPEQFADPGYIRIEDIARLTAFDHILSFYLRRGCREAVLFPMREAGELAKIVVLGARESEQLSDAVIQPFSNLIDVSGSALGSFRILQKLEDRLADLQVLAGVGQSVSIETDLASLYSSLHEQAMKATGEDVHFAVAIYNLKAGQIEIPYFYEGPGKLRSLEPFPLGQGLTSHILNTKQPLLINQDTLRTAEKLGARVVDEKPAKSWLGVPLIVGGQSIGAIILQDTEHEDRFSERDLNLFTTMAPQIATAIRNAQLLSEMEQTARQLTTASEIARESSGSLQLDVLLNKAVNLVRERFGFYHASIFLIEPGGKYAVLRESSGEVGQQMKAAGHRLGVGSQSIVGQAAQQARPLVINDVTREPDYYANPLLPETKAELAIPLKTGDQVLGILDVQSTQPNAYDQQNITVLTLLADQLAVAVMNARLFSRSLENLEQHRRLHEITTAAASAANMQEVFSVTVNGLKTGLLCDTAAIYLLSGNRLEMHASTESLALEEPGVTLEIGEGVAGLVAKEQKPLLLTGLEAEQPVQAANEPHHSHIAAPILYGGDQVGVLHMASRQYAAFDENTLDLLGMLANSLGAILYNARLIEAVRKQVERERIIYEATNRIHRSVDIHTILQTSASEIARAVGARRAHIEIIRSEAQTATETGGDNHNDGKEAQE